MMGGWKRRTAFVVRNLYGQERVKPTRLSGISYRKSALTAAQSE